MWNQTFRKKVIALLLEKVWWVNHGKVIAPEYFENEAEVLLVRSIYNFYSEYKRPPTYDELEVYLEKQPIRIEARKQEVRELAREIYEGYKVWELDFARSSAIEFAKVQAFKLSMLDAIDLIDKSESIADSEIYEVLSSALSVGNNSADSIKLIEDVETWLMSVATEEKIPTGMFHVDAMLEGGLSRGEIGVIMAPPNYGKSMALVNIGFGASSIASQSKVAHVTLEISKERIAKRYAARTSFGWYTKRLDPYAYKDKFLLDASKRLYGDIDISGGPPGTISCDDLRRHLDYLLNHEFPVDLLIVDYADEMNLPRAENNFERHGENYRQLKTLAVEYNIGVWTASQTNRASLRKLTVDIDDIAESFKKAARADIMLAWCQTPEEEDDSEMRWFCSKNRDGLKHWYVRSKLHADSHAITTQEILWGADLVKRYKDN